MNKSLIFKTFRLFIAAAVLCLVCPLQKAVAQSDSGITIKMDNARLESVLDAIEQQSKYLFLNDQVDLSKTVSINVSDADIKVVLVRIEVKDCNLPFIIFIRLHVAVCLDAYVVLRNCRRETLLTVGEVSMQE